MGRLPITSARWTLVLPTFGASAPTPTRPIVPTNLQIHSQIHSHVRSRPHLRTNLVHSSAHSLKSTPTDPQAHEPIHQAMHKSTNARTYPGQASFKGWQPPPRREGGGWVPLRHPAPPLPPRGVPPDPFGFPFFAKCLIFSFSGPYFFDLTVKVKFFFGAPNTTSILSGIGSQKGPQSPILSHSVNCKCYFSPFVFFQHFQVLIFEINPKIHTNEKIQSSRQIDFCFIYL